MKDPWRKRPEPCDPPHGSFMTVSRRTLISALAPAALQLTAGAAWSKGHRLQLSAAYGDGIFHTQNLRNFAARVHADTQQALEIDVVSNSALKPIDRKSTRLNS